MESALDVLSRAATMVQQDNENEARLTTKELPTAKWRRERRLRAGEYHTTAATTTTITGQTSPPCSPTPPPHLNASMHSIQQHHQHHLSHHYDGTTTTATATATTSAAHNLQHNLESPIDMSVTSTTMKQRSSPPPPYREPLPGSNYATTLARPSVITQAPPKRGSGIGIGMGIGGETILITNRDNDSRGSDSISTCETVIDEHFRRSLGANYLALFGKKSPASTSANSTTPSPPVVFTNQTIQPHLNPHAIKQESNINAMMIVDGLPPPQDEPLALQQTSRAQSPITATATATTASTPPIATKLGIAITPTPIASPTLINSRNSSPQLIKLGAAISTATANNIGIPLLQQTATIKTNDCNDDNGSLTPPPPPLSSSSSSSLSNEARATASTPTTLQNQIIINSSELHSTNLTANVVAAAATMAYSPTPSPRQSPNTPPILVTSTTPTPPITIAALPAIMRIKTEPGLISASTTTPPASPTSPIPLTNTSVTTTPISSISPQATNCATADVLASVDDHFAKALGDTWKKLKEGKELRK